MILRKCSEHLVGIFQMVFWLVVLVTASHFCILTTIGWEDPIGTPEGVLVVYAALGGGLLMSIVLLCNIYALIAEMVSGAIGSSKVDL